MKPLDRQDMEDILNGATIFGSGGGGPRAAGQAIIDHITKQQRPVQLADPAEVGADAWMAVTAMVGSPDAAGGGFALDVATIAYQALQKTLKRQFAFVLPGEVGAGNSFVPMVVASSLNLPVVDAAGAHRAIPSLTMCTYAADKVPISPLILANHDHEVALTVADAKAAEGPMRAIISQPEFGEIAGIAFWAMAGQTMRAAAIPYTLSDAQKLGTTLRQALAEHADPVAAVAEQIGGRVLCCGRIVDAQEATRGGFDFGQVVLQLAGSDAKVTIYNQNENLILWRSDRDRPLVMGPDLICYLTTDGLAFSNAELDRAKGKEVAVIGAPCSRPLRAPSIVAAFQGALCNLGYAGPYVPFEELGAGG